ncbi:DUF429 domain-containing protein [Alicyclobacillus fastidiosus]|uniref:DUF429 domain-containing protein n=1 Tax=Alicyclobacillus fastidiosus TaxID=392011 RepID=A0ABY6ZDI7_9BACL|nr:DUF429 domain-containing protein [Alicyclobacillus fastidiosus]WAH40311.1 DUF429 domain-containing protein [Alicyclobacillus fastidiosus]GMA61691.1 hypothetical protein GCM10025859_21310 [Alicyclobacillus fastidiosus]
MSLVGGVDCGTERTVSTIAWLDTETKAFQLDAYIPSVVTPLPTYPSKDVSCVGFDCPQGLPIIGQKTRLADRQANTPTRSLPQTRHDLLNNHVLYRGLIQLGVSVFWNVFENEQAVIYGLNAIDAPPSYNKPLIFETYPRFALDTLFGLKSSIKYIPSKRKTPIEYIDLVWHRIQRLGYTCSSIIRPTVDQVDSMLCAIAAEDVVRGSCVKVGREPFIDTEDRIIREGFIAVPGRRQERWI